MEVSMKFMLTLGLVFGSLSSVAMAESLIPCPHAVSGICENKYVGQVCKVYKVNIGQCVLAPSTAGDMCVCRDMTVPEDPVSQEPCDKKPLQKHCK
jgi:hypothetical protein